MSNPIIATGNELDGTYVVREMTDDEAAEYAAYREELEASRKKKDDELKAKDDARKKIIEKLGLSETELRLLLGI